MIAITDNLTLFAKHTSLEVEATPRTNYRHIETMCLLRSQPSPSATPRQGALGDCWLLAAMATLAEHDAGTISDFQRCHLTSQLVKDTQRFSRHSKIPNDTNMYEYERNGSQLSNHESANSTTVIGYFADDVPSAQNLDSPKSIYY